LKFILSLPAKYAGYDEMQHCIKYQKEAAPQRGGFFLSLISMSLLKKGTTEFTEDTEKKSTRENSVFSVSSVVKSSFSVESSLYFLQLHRLAGNDF